MNIDVAFCKDIMKAMLLTRGINFTGAIVCTSYLSVSSDLKKNTATSTNSLAQNTFDCSRKSNNNISSYNNNNREGSKSKIHILTLAVMDKYTPNNMNKHCS